MVHALETIHRLLKPAGCLIDIHPVAGASAIEVHDGRQIIFSAAVPPFSEDDIRHAEAALAEVLRRGIFHVERRANFDFRAYAGSLAELRAYYEEATAYDDNPEDEAFVRWAAGLAPQVTELMRTAGEGARVAYQEKVHISRLEKR